MRNPLYRILLSLVALLSAGADAASAATDYLPLNVGTRWVLRNPGAKTPVVIEVASKSGDTYRIHFTHPWGSNDWDLESRGGKIYMTGYGQNDQLAPLGSENVFFDFTANKEESWKNTIGNLTLMDTRQTVKAGDLTFSNCVQIRQVSGGAKFYYSFAPGIGFVQFGEGKNAFIVDLKESRLPHDVANSVNKAKAKDDNEDRPVQHVPGPVGNPNQGTSTVGRKPAARVADSRALQVGVTTSLFANEAQTPQNLLKRFEQTVDAGISFLSSAQKWTELEPKPGQYNLEGLDFQVQYAEKLKIPMSVTLRLIDTVDRVLPEDVRRLAWDDPKMEKRVLALVDAMAPRFHGRVKWFMFGNEIDGYFGRHPNEVKPFAHLLSKVAARMKQLSPGIQVSSTIMFGGIDTLNGLLGPLNDQFEFLSITYYPIRGDFTMRAPDAPATDVPKMRQAAGGRKVVLQEIGYATSPLNASSQEKQADFYKAMFDALRQNRDLIEAGNFFLLADLPDKFVKDLGGFYGITGSKVFLAYLQSLGMFDLDGRPKKSWDVFRSELKRAK